MAGAAVALDIATGEVLVLASKPDYDLSDFTPRVSTAKYAEIDRKRRLVSTGPSGALPARVPPSRSSPPSQGLRDGAITPDSKVIDCQGY
jgi:penicillin-binding protein 2